MEIAGNVFLLYREISDQYGTTEVVGVYSSLELAQSAGAKERRGRTFVKSMELDAAPAKGRSW
jgi:hypothetical protein